MAAAVDYLAELGSLSGAGSHGAPESSLRERCRCAMTAIRQYEQMLSLELLRVLRDCGADIYGIREEARIAERVPTVCFNIPAIHPAAVAEAAAAEGIGLRDGHMYSPRLMRRLGLPIESGAVRVSLAHYNTVEEVGRLGALLSRLRKSPTSVLTSA